MDAGLITSAVIGILSNHGTDLAKKAGGAAVKAAQQIYNAVKEHFAKNNQAKQTFELYEQNPEIFEGALKLILQQQFEQNQTFAKQIQELLATFEKVAPSEMNQIILRGSGAIATNGSVAAGEGGYAAGGDIHIGAKPDEK